MAAPINVRSPLSAVFLLHVALEIPFAVQGLFMTSSLPFLELTNTTLVIVKLYATLSLASCIGAFLCYGLPEFLPGKRAFAVMLVVYHSVASTVFYQSPRFIPISFGPLAESFKLTPETAWGTAHGLLSLALAAWWQLTLGITTAVKAQQGKSQ